MKDLMHYVQLCQQDLRTLGIPYGAVSRWEVNTRAKTRWGLCRKGDDGTFAISIARALLEDGTEEQALRDTVIHELLHTVPGCFDHGKQWKYYAALINRRFPGYRVKRNTTREEKGVSAPVSRYLIRCIACGVEIPRLKGSNLVKYPERYRCGKCGGKLLRVR